MITIEKKENQEEIRKPKSLWSDARKRILKNYLAMIGAVIIILLVFIAIFAPIISPHNPNAQYKNGTTSYGMPFPINTHSKMIVAKIKNTDSDFTIRSSIVFTDIKESIRFRTVVNTKVKKGESNVKILVAPLSPKEIGTKSGIKIITEDKISKYIDSMTLENDKYFLLGTDARGRDTLSRLIWGSQVSLKVGIGAVTIAVLIGVTMGLISGFFGKWIDLFIMRITDIMMSFPELLLVMAIVAIKGPGLWVIFFAIGIVTWTGIARIVRSQVLYVREMEFIEASKAAGAKNSLILIRHVLPNVIAPVIVIATMGIAGAIMTEAGLSFLGFGIKEPTASWGSMVNQGLGFFRDAPWVPIIPGVAIAITVFAFNLFGDGVRDAIDPKQD